jgi:hypothetical protein
MEILETTLALAGFAIIGWHIFSAYGFRSAMEKEGGGTWK